MQKFIDTLVPGVKLWSEIFKDILFLDEVKTAGSLFDLV